MRVLVTSVASSGPLCMQLSTLGFEMAAIQPAYVDLGDFGSTRTRAAAGLPYTLVPPRVFPVRPYPYSLYLGGVADLVRRFQPDVLYGIGEPSELGIWQVVRLTRRHSPQTRIVLCSYENLRRDWSGFPRCLRGFAERATLPRVDMVAAGSHTAAATLIASGYDARRIRVVYTGVDEGRFQRCDAPAVRMELASGGGFVIGYVGRLVPEKGVDMLLQALANLPASCILAIAGSGRQEPELRALAARLGVADRVRWLGRVSYPQMPALYSALDAVAVPSRGISVWREQYGRVLVEAMLCGTPVVGSSSGAIPEVIGDAGLVFDEGDTGALTERLRRVAEEPGLAEELARRGLDRAAEQFTLEAQMRGLGEAFRQALELPAR